MEAHDQRFRNFRGVEGHDIKRAPGSSRDNIFARLRGLVVDFAGRIGAADLDSVALVPVQGGGGGRWLHEVSPASKAPTLERVSTSGASSAGISGMVSGSVGSTWS